MTKILSRIFLLLLAIFFLCHSVIVAAEEDSNAEAISITKSWLSAIDSGNYANSWDNAAAYFQHSISKPDWESQLRGVREPLGKLIERKVISSRTFNSLPGAPDGHYVVIQFKSSFEQKNIAIETVTPMMDANGTWRVSGYYIR